MSEQPINLRSAREIRLLRQAGLVVWEAHQAAARVIRPGATTAQIDEAVAGVLRRHQATPLFQGQPGPYPFPAVTCVSINEQVVHGIPGPRELREGDIVSIDTGCMVRGWCADAAVTHAVGTLQPNVQKLLEVTQGALNLAIERMGEHDYWSEVALEISRYVRAAGFSVVEAFVGHGIGRQLHENPQYPNFVSDALRRDDIQLRPGLVMAIEPMVNMGTKEVECLEDGWTQVTKDRLPSAHFEHTIALTADGPLLLTGPPLIGETI
jgi:methionyl aminopeptidase